MPLYDFDCGVHREELVRPLGTDTIPCPHCGRTATRSHVHRFDVVGPTVDTRGMFRRYTEATQELDHRYSKAESNIGHPIPSPDLWGAAKSKVRKLVAAGEI